MSKGFTSFEVGRAIVQTIITLAVGVWFIVCFAIYRPDPKDSSRPKCRYPVDVWLLVSGIAQIVFLLITLCATFIFRIGVKETSGNKQKAGCGTLMMTLLLCTFLLFMFIWWIVGQVWTFSITKYQCNEIVHQTAFWFFIVTYIMFGVAIIIVIIVCVCGTCIGLNRK